MAPHRHIIIEEPGQELDYTKPPGGGGAFKIPSRDRRVHARKLQSDVSRAINDANSLAERTGHIIHDICLEIIGEDHYDLKIESLQDFRLKPPIEVLSVKRIDDKEHATIYVPEGKLKNFVKKIESYKGESKNENLVAPVSTIRFPVLRSFWTDDEDLFPSSNTERIWWEV